MDGDLGEARKGKSVALVLDTDLDVARGAVLAAPDAPPVKAQSIEAHLVWLSERPFDAARSLLLRTAADLVPVAAMEVAGSCGPRYTCPEARKRPLGQRHRRRIDHAWPGGSTRSLCGA